MSAAVCIAATVMSVFLMLLFKKMDNGLGKIKLKIPISVLLFCVCSSILYNSDMKNTIASAAVYSLMAFCYYTDSQSGKIYTTVCLFYIIAGLAVILTGEYYAEELLFIIAVYIVYISLMYGMVIIDAIGVGDAWLFSACAIWFMYMEFSPVFLAVHFIVSSLIFIIGNLKRLIKKDRVPFGGSIYLGTFITVMLNSVIGGIVCL